MLHARRASIALLAAFALFLGPVAPAHASTTATLSGTITLPGGGAYDDIPYFNTRVYLKTAPSVNAYQALVNADGSYSISGIAPGDYRLYFSPAGASEYLALFSNLTDRYADAAVVTFTASQARTENFELRIGARITGSLSGEGDVGISTQVSFERVHPDTHAVLATYTTSSSESYRSFTSNRLPAGHYRVSTPATGQSWIPYLGGAAVLEESQPFEVSWGETFEHPDIVLQRTPHFAGQVTVVPPANGSPVSTVQVIADSVDPSIPNRYKTVDQDGRFIVDGLVAGEEYQVCTIERSPEDFYRTALPKTCYGATAPQSDGVTLVATEDGQTDIDITLTSGSGVVFYRVWWEPAPGVQETPGSITARYWRWDDSLGQWVLEADTADRSGGASSPIMQAGDYRIEIRYWVDAVQYREYYPGVDRFADAEIVPVDERTVTWFQDGLKVNPRAPGFDRIAGADRFAGAVALSKSAFETGSGPVVFIANGLNYPDALAAGPAASAMGGPLLLVTPTAIPAVVQAELSRLRPSRIVIVGGTASVSSTVQSRLRNYVESSSDVVRLAGADRYATSRELVSTVFGDTTDAIVFVATGANYPDALAAGAAAGYFGGPVVLVDGARSSLDSATRSMLDGLEPGAIIIAGGPGAVSTSLERALRSRYSDEDSPVIRLFGDNRYETAFAINQLFTDADAVYLASGEGFADALAGGPIAALSGSPLYLTLPNCIPRYVDSDIDQLLAREVIIIGGTAVVQSRVQRGALC